ncbi:hypothetical protein AYO47_08215 [Planctomyces sp. SCGC AG-212-M04]|nr:hypothetical protein AYO47_08215 [Planctomyces sp. SCGC AG-212-M04]
MFLFEVPSDTLIRDFLASQRDLAFTYSAVGSSQKGKPPAGFNVDHTRARLGAGREAFEAGREALCHWKQFDLGWVKAGPSQTPIEVGQVIAVWATILGVAVINACQIVYVIYDDGPMTRYGFAYGTLPGHIESGEERFMVEWDRASNDVHYDILAFSRPRHWTARLGYPFARLQQRRFARDSAVAMQEAVAAVTGRR